MTSHGTPLTSGPGSPNVFIGSKPAWRVGDMHTCPLAELPGIPHVGGSVPVGSTTVFINNLPAVRQGDIIIETGPPNTITVGDTTVLIG